MLKTLAPTFTWPELFLEVIFTFARIKIIALIFNINSHSLTDFSYKNKYGLFRFMCVRNLPDIVLYTLNFIQLYHFK